MADGKKKNDGFRAGFMADMLRNLEDELGIEKSAKGTVNAADSQRNLLIRKERQKALARRRPGLPRKAPLCRQIPLRNTPQCLLYTSRR